MATVADDFTELVLDTALTAHTPTGANAGTGWTEEEITGIRFQQVIASTDTVTANAAENDDRHIYTLQPNPAVSAYDVQAELTAVTTVTKTPWFFVARFTDTDNYYSAGTYRDADAADKKIFKKVAGTVTELASGDSGIAAGDVLRFDIRDATKTLFKNGVEELSTTDNALTSAGRAGFGVGNAWVATDEIRTPWDADNFQYVEQAAAAATHSGWVSSRGGWF